MRPHRTNKSKAIISIATTSLLVLSSLDRSMSSAAAAIVSSTDTTKSYSNTNESKILLPKPSNNNNNNGRLTQHRIKSPNRNVPYPDNHPLGRHLITAPIRNEAAAEAEGNLDVLEDAEEEEEGESSSIVGGDGSRLSHQKQFQIKHRLQQQREQENNIRPGGGRFLRFLNEQIIISSLENESSKNNKGRKRRRRDAVDMNTSEQQQQPETIQEGQLFENNSQTLRYWTISGRNLVTTTTALASAVSNNDINATTEKAAKGEEEYNEEYSSAALLMNVEQILGENELTEEEEGEKEGREQQRQQSQQGQEHGVAVEEGGLSSPEDGDENHQAQSEEDNAFEPTKSSPQTTNSEDEIIPNEQQSEEKDQEGEGTQSEEKSKLYQPIRLRAIFTDDPTSGSNYLTNKQRRILMEDMINPALFAWSQALHLVPVGSGSGEGGSNKDKLVVDQSQLYDGKSCGPGLDSGMPSVRVPREHMTDGLEDTDTVIYVSVSFAENIGDASLSAASETASEVSSGGMDTLHSLYHLHRGATGPKYVVPETRKKDGVYDVNETLSDSEILDNETTANPSDSPSHQPSSSPTETEPLVETRPICPGTYLASATYCSSDQYDRPVAGILSLCISDVHKFFYNPDQIKRNIVTIMHEIGHILGFNAQSLAHFRNSDTGEPLTERDENGDVPQKQVECTGISPRSHSEVPLPGKDVLKFQSVRGGVRVATIVTPTVQRVAQNMFGCQKLIGAELESGEGQMFSSMSDSEELGELSPGECIGDHWDRRLFRTDLMNTIVDDVPYSLYISSLTLAYFADSGWYKVDTDRIAPVAIWGRNAGCDFVNQRCITKSGHVSAGNNPFFCNNFLEHLPEEEVTEIHGCDLESSRKAVCSLVEYESAIPKEYDYFAHDKDNTQYYGGRDPTLDFCPVFEGFVNGRCDDEESQDVMGVRKSLEVFGEVNSRCVIGHVDRKRTALCLPIACVIQEQQLMVKVDGYWKPCSYAGQIISVWWNPNDYVTCPDPSRVCPTFYCPNDCFKEGGICDYQTGQCMCAISTTQSTVNTTSWIQSYNSYQRFGPCSGKDTHLGTGSGLSQVVERIDFELPDYYVENTTVLLDDPRDFESKLNRMFSQLNSGEVVGLVASFIMCALFSYIIWSVLVKFYRGRLFPTSLSKMRSSVGSLSQMLRSASRSSLENHQEHDEMDSPPPQRRRPRGQKDKMVATLLVQMRTEGTTAEEEQHRRLQLGGLAPTWSDESEEKKSQLDASTYTPTIVDLSSPSDEEVLVNRSELPQLPEGRVLAVVGARIVEDETIGSMNDAESIVTSATQASEFTSPLYQDDNDGRDRGTGGRMLRLRRHID